MVALTFTQRMNLPLAPIAAGIVALAAALAMAIVPQWRIEGLVIDSGLPALLAAAEPPLGTTARITLMLAAALAAGGATWIAALFLLAPRRVRTPRRADRHPDAPVREPVMAARDLGTPFLDVTARADVEADAPEVALPTDLDVPMAAFDPLAIPPEPAMPAATVAPLCRLPIADRGVAANDAGEDMARIETFELTPPTRLEPRAVPCPDPAEPIAAPETDATIHALLERLERGIVRRRSSPAMTERPEAEGLEQALVTLRRLAAPA